MSLLPSNISIHYFFLFFCIVTAKTLIIILNSFGLNEHLCVRLQKCIKHLFIKHKICYRFWYYLYQIVKSPFTTRLAILKNYSVNFSHSVVSNSFQPHGLQYTRPPCPSPTPSLPKLMAIQSVMPSNYLILCRRLLRLPSIFPSIRIFSKESVLHIRWPKYWGFSYSISLSNEYSGLTSFRKHC